MGTESIDPVGLVQRSKIPSNLDESSTITHHLLIRDLKPPFLDGKQVYTKQLEAILPVKDPTSDLAVIARKGSAVVMAKREREERAKAVRDVVSTANTALGNIMGEKEEEKEVKESDGMLSTAVSSFATTKTLSQQRQYLPVFAVREEMMRVVRDNQVIVIVGETGSGKVSLILNRQHN